MTDHGPASDALIHQLVGNQMSSVTFVQDYLQIDFDGLRLTFNIWPSVITDREIRFGDINYRNELCSLIGKIVTSTSETETRLAVIFGTHSLRADLTEATGRERVVFDNTQTHEWEWW